MQIWPCHFLNPICDVPSTPVTYLNVPLPPRVSCLPALLSCDPCQECNIIYRSQPPCLCTCRFLFSSFSSHSLPFHLVISCLFLTALASKSPPPRSLPLLPHYREGTYPVCCQSASCLSLVILCHNCLLKYFVSSPKAVSIWLTVVFSMLSKVLDQLIQFSQCLLNEWINELMRSLNIAVFSRKQLTLICLASFPSGHCYGHANGWWSKGKVLLRRAQQKVKILFHLDQWPWSIQKAVAVYENNYLCL